MTNGDRPLISYQPRDTTPARRFSFHTTRVSPSRMYSSAAWSAGRSRCAPEAFSSNTLLQPAVFRPWAEAGRRLFLGGNSGVADQHATSRNSSGG